MSNINISSDIYASRKYKLKAMHRWNNNYIEKNAIKKTYTENYASIQLNLHEILNDQMLYIVKTKR